LSSCGHELRFAELEALFDPFVMRYLFDKLNEDLQKGLSQVTMPVPSVPPSPNAGNKKTPRWDAQRHQLWVDNMVVKSIRPIASNVFAVLEAFEKGRWADRIANPLPQSPAGNDWTRLHDTIRSLNDSLIRIAFHADGTGNGITWNWV